ncbi:MAG: DUF1127 domain-containing protein [Rhodobacteraceae bacterium]|nr:DUF1127 domain-containing protein [Paracoccaceae bacterium]
MASPILTTHAPATAARRPALGRVLKALLAMRAAHRQRRHLARLDDQRLHDIGLSRDAALREAARPFWDAPGYWR